MQNIQMPRPASPIQYSVAKTTGWRFSALRILTFATILLAAAAPQALAGSGTIQVDADAQYRFAREALESGSYAQAVFEFRRFLHFFPLDPRAGEARLAVGRALFLDRQFHAAISAFNEVVEKDGDTPLAARSFLETSRCHLALGETGAALQALNNLLLFTDDADLRDDAWFRIGWIRLDQGDFEAARQAFGRIRPEGRQRLGVREMEDRLDRVDAIPRKSPEAAGLFSLVPGGGYLYCGLKRDALVAFLVNGALIAAAWEAFDNDLPVIGGLLAVVEVGFYAGNIYGGVNSAHKYNQYQEKAFFDRLREDSRLRMGACDGGRGGWLALEVAF